jgi:hypothetical protein
MIGLKDDDGQKRRVSRYIGMVRAVFKVCRRQCVPLYSSRFSRSVYHQRSKRETVFSVVKRTMGDEIRSVSVKGANNEIRARFLAYNAWRIADRVSSYLKGFLQSLGVSSVLFRLFGGHEAGPARCARAPQEVRRECEQPTLE